MPETIPTPGRVEFTIPGRTDFVALARSGISELLANVPEDACADAQLILDEFTANAILWSRSGADGNVEILAEHEPGSNRVRIEVTDDGSLSDEEKAAAKAARMRDDCEQYERGLTLVNGLADDWGHQSKDGRGIYWAVLAWD